MAGHDEFFLVSSIQTIRLVLTLFFSRYIIVTIIDRRYPLLFNSFPYFHHIFANLVRPEYRLAFAHLQSLSVL